jgi:hypothetical protein
MSNSSGNGEGRVVDSGRDVLAWWVPDAVLPSPLPVDSMDLGNRRDVKLRWILYYKATLAGLWPRRGCV